MGVLEAGGFPLEFPVMSLGEVLLRPTAMLYRNLASMDVEESIRGNPLDGVVLLVGCDKTTPALLMGAASVDVPAIAVSGGPMLNGRYKDQTLGSGTSVWQMREDLYAGRMRLEEFHEAEACTHRSHGHCMTMGTASTMACMVEALGIGMPGNAAYPAVDARRNLLARMAGRRIVDLVKEDVKISDILTRPAFENAIRTLAAIGGSTNAVVHLIAIARRLGAAGASRLRRAGAACPLVDLQPSGRYLMEDFTPAACRSCCGRCATCSTRGARGDRPNRSPITWPARGSGTRRSSGPGPSRSRPTAGHRRVARQPRPGRRGHQAVGGLPGAAAAPGPGHRLRPSRTSRRVDDPALDVDEDSVLVLRGLRAQGLPGMPEVATCRCRPSCWSGACPTWCGSATAGCPAPPTARWSCTSPRRPRRRPAGPGADRRLDRPGRPGRRLDSRSTRPTPAGTARRLAAARPARQPGLDAAVLRARAAGRRGRRSGLPGRGQWPRGPARVALTAPPGPPPGNLHPGPFPTVRQGARGARRPSG